MIPTTPQKCCEKNRLTKIQPTNTTAENMKTQSSCEQFNGPYFNSAHSNNVFA